MAIRQLKRPVAAARIAAVAQDLLDAASLCAIATVTPRGRAYVSTAYFAWSPAFEIVWMSEPEARHSLNIRAHGSVAVAVYHSDQTWGKPDRGIQLFGSAREAAGRVARDAQRLYSARFAASEVIELPAYRFYRFRPQRLKLFDEGTLGAGVFVSADVAAGKLAWRRTDVYRTR